MAILQVLLLVSSKYMKEQLKVDGDNTSVIGEVNGYRQGREFGGGCY